MIIGNHLTRVALILATFVAGQALLNPAISQEPPPLFVSEEPLDFTLIMDVKELKKDDSDNPKYSPGKLILHEGQEDQSFDIKVKARGISRRKFDFCSFPPIKLNFKKKAVSETVFEGQDKLKLVAFCKDSDLNESYVLKEYLVYKMYNCLTPYSFKVRLARITYKDINDKAKDVMRFGFLIEDNDVMAKRNGAKISEITLPTQDRCEQNSLNLFTLFQFMIGNTDWSAAKQHNVKLIIKDDGTVIPVPYDFDFCGFVNARYANPPEQLEITDVRQRLFRGNCRLPGTYEKIVDSFNLHRQCIYSQISSLGELDEKNKKIASKYIDDFYKIINDQKSLKRMVYDACDVSHKHLHTGADW